jgi:small subunit ribosomal protein S2e
MTLVQWEGPEGDLGMGAEGSAVVSGTTGLMKARLKIRSGSPVTKLGCLVNDMKIKSLEEIYLFSLPIKESDY